MDGTEQPMMGGTPDMSPQLQAIQQALAAMGITGPRTARPGTVYGAGQDARAAPMQGGGGGGQQGGGGGGGGAAGAGGAQGSGSGFTGLIGKLGGMFGKGSSGLMPGVPGTTLGATNPLGGNPTSQMSGGIPMLLKQAQIGLSMPAVGTPGGTPSITPSASQTPTFAQPGLSGITPGAGTPAPVQPPAMGPFPAPGGVNANNIPVPAPPSQYTAPPVTQAPAPAPSAPAPSPTGVDAVPGGFQGASLDPSSPTGQLFGMFQPQPQNVGMTSMGTPMDGTGMGGLDASGGFGMAGLDGGGLGGMDGGFGGLSSLFG